MRKGNGKVSAIIAVCAAMLLAAGLVLAPLAGCVNTASAAVTSVKINKTNFPDPVFRAIISGPEYDRDGNGVLDAREIGLTLNIYCEGMGVQSLKGVEYFVDLQGLWCKDNEISSLDVRALKDLRGLWCSNNPLTSLDLSQNKELVWVYCYDCNLTALDVSHNPKMAFIECNTNPITELDVSHNPELEHLTCGSCKLRKLDVSHNPKLAHLDAFRNKFKSLDVTNNPKMKRLDIWDNPGLKSIDISQNPELQYYNCANNDATTVDVSHNPELQKLICSYNDLTSLDLSNNPKLVCLNCEDNRLSKLDLSNNPQLRYLQAAINPFTSINIGNNPFLVKTYREGKFTQEWFGRSWTINYGGKVSTGGDNLFYIWLNDGVSIGTKATGTVTLAEEKYSELEPGVVETDLVKREKAVEILYAMAGSPSVSGLQSRFTDVQSGKSYTKALLWGEKNAICVGYPYTAADTFGVGKWLTRQDLVFMLMRYSELMKYKRAIDFGRSDDYIDYFDIDYDHWEAICWSATWIIMEGKGEPDAPKSEQRIDPYGIVTREEFKTIVRRLLEVNDVTLTSSLSAILNKVDDLPLQIIGQPVNVTVNKGETASFSVNTVGTGTVTYRWQTLAPGATEWVDSASASAKKATFDITAQNGHNGYRFRCIVKDSTGKERTSSAATLTVKSSDPPTIKTQPKNVTVAAGETVSFSVAVSGLPPFSYQWQTRAPGSTEWKNASSASAKRATLTITAQDGHNGYQFRCIVTSANNKKVVSGAATLTVSTAPVTIRTQPQRTSLQAGRAVSFSVTATGVAPLTYQWQTKAPDSSVWKDSASASAKKATFTLTAQNGHNGYQFRCIVTGANGKKATSSAATLVVSTAPPVIATQPKNVSVTAGTSATFTVAAIGVGTLTYQWQTKAPGTNSWKNSTNTTAKKATFKLATQAGHNGYQVRCLVTAGNGMGVETTVATLTVK